MAYRIEEQTLAPKAVLYIRRRVAPDQLAATFAEVLPAVFGYAVQAGFEMTGPPFARYLEFGDTITVEAGCPVAEGATGSGEIEHGVIPGGRVAMTIHHGRYQKLGAAHEAVEHWIDATGRTADGGPWESYLTDPGDAEDAKDLQTAVYRPIRD